MPIYSCVYPPRECQGLGSQFGSKGKAHVARSFPKRSMVSKQVDSDPRLPSLSLPSFTTIRGWLETSTLLYCQAMESLRSRNMTNIAEFKS
jgi:hypothetical protein